MVGIRKGAFAEESAEVEVLFANMEKMKSLTKKIQGSMNRLDASGKTVQEAVGPIYGNTQKLQTTNTNVDKIIEAIDRLRAPLDQTDREERIIRAGPKRGDVRDYIAALDRITVTLSDLKRSNLRSNQEAINKYGSLTKQGAKSLEEVFRDELRQASAGKVEPLEYVLKGNDFPTLPQEKQSTLRNINQHISNSVAQMSQTDLSGTPTQRIYADIRGDYLVNSLRTLVLATINSTRKVQADAVYRAGENNAIQTYTMAIEGLFRAEYESICPIFARNEWGQVYTATCTASLREFDKTMRELNQHIQRNLMTDCFLGYEIVDVVTKLSIRLEQQTGELKKPVSDAIRPIRETAKASLGKLLEDTRTRVQTLVALPMDGAPVPITNDTMTRLREMTNYLVPLGSILTSLGPGGWKGAGAASSSSSLPTMKSFDVGADGGKLFLDYASDTVDTLLQNLEGKGKTLLKSKNLQGVFLANNVAILDRGVRSPDVQSVLGGLAPKLEGWRKKSSAAYLEAWREPSGYLLDVQYTNRNNNRNSGGAGDSATIVKALSSKEKDAVKEKFKNFNTSFDDLVGRHKSYKMEREVRAQLVKDVQNIIEPLYGRFWDRYHEIDKGKGKYVKYDKSGLAGQFASLN